MSRVPNNQTLKLHKQRNVSIIFNSLEVFMTLTFNCVMQAEGRVKRDEEMEVASVGNTWESLVKQRRNRFRVIESRRGSTDRVLRRPDRIQNMYRGSSLLGRKDSVPGNR